MYAFVLIAQLVVGFIAIRLGNDSPLLPTLAIALAAIIWSVVAWAIYQHFKADLYKGKVEYVGGRIHIFREGKGSGRKIFNYRLLVSNHVFVIDYMIARAFDEGEFYGVYFVPNSKTILSAEKLGKI